MIARDWNVKHSGSGYVTRFHVRRDFLGNYETTRSAAAPSSSTGSRPRTWPTSTPTSSAASRSSPNTTRTKKPSKTNGLPGGRLGVRWLRQVSTRQAWTMSRSGLSAVSGGARVSLDSSHVLNSHVC
jgi:hypothetical protein